jgi:cold shock CspA family protein/ribosome-associated translation inhibitor RaiA
MPFPFLFLSLQAVAVDLLEKSAIKVTMILPVQVSFRNMEPDGLDEYVREQAAKLERYFQGITSCRVVVEMRGRHRHGNAYHVRIDLGVPGKELVVKHEPNLYSALRDAQVEKARKSHEAGRVYRNPRRAILDAFAEMRRQLQDYVRTRRGKVKAHAEGLSAGTVARLFPEEGYGFLSTADGREVYFHQDSVLNGWFSRLRVGAAVRFSEEMGDKGPQATTVHVVHPSKQSQAAARAMPLKRRATT